MDRAEWAYRKKIELEREFRAACEPYIAMKMQIYAAKMPRYIVSPSTGEWWTDLNWDFSPAEQDIIQRIDLGIESIASVYRCMIEQV